MQATDRSLPLGRCAAALVGLLVVCLAARAQAPAAARAVVSDVIIQGNRFVTAEEIRAQIKTRPNVEYNPETVQEDLRTLYATRKFGNVYADKQEDGPGRVKIYFFIRDYPSVVDSVEYRGAKHFSQEDLDQLTSVRKGAPLNPIANKVACRRIVERYHEEGRPFASCDLISGGEPGDTKVVFNITEGPKVRIGDIQFEGNSFVSSAVLKTHIHASDGLLGLGFFGGVYNPPMIEADVSELERYYRSFGFHDARISRELRYAADGRTVTIVYHVQEGVRYRVKEVPDVLNAASLPREALQAMSKVKPGDFYDEKVIQGDISRIKDYYGYRGYEVRAQPVPVYSREVPGLMTVNYEVEERPPAKVGQIFILGNERTRQNVILRQLPVYPGQILSYPDLRQAERNLAKLGIFKSSPDGSSRPTVSVMENPSNPEAEYKDVLVNVQEDNTGSLLFGLGVNSDVGLTGSIVLNERNFDLFRPPTSIEDLLSGGAFRGAGQEFRIEAVPGTQLQRYTVTFREPFLFDTPFSLTTSGYYYTRYYNEYQETREGGRFSLGRKLNQFWSVGTTLRMENVAVNAVPLGAPIDYTSVVGNNFLLGGRVNVTRDSRDSYMRPTQGSLIDFGYEEVTGANTFPLVNLDLNKYFTTYQRADGSGRHVVAAHTMVGWAGSNTPVYERFFAGGFRTLRGFQFRGVGPDVNGFKVGGDFLLLNSLEYQIPLKADDKVYFVSFVDGGTVANRVDDLDKYRVSVGFGLRLVVPMLGPVPIALDFGFPIVKAASDTTQVFNFWMGFTR